MFDQRDCVLIIGAGRSGIATAEVLRARKVTVAVFDDQPAEKLGDSAATLLCLGAALIRDAELPAAAAAATAAVVSPGVPLTNPAVLEVVRAGVPVFSEIEVAYQLSAAPVIAVTGSKGKSTTTALIGHILRTAGLRARVGGNIGNPLIRETAQAGADEWIVAEVSSFQLEGIRAFAPRISVLLNISPDHLDRYPSMDEYAEAKYRIFANQGSQDVFVGNADDPLIATLRTGRSRQIPAQTRWYGMNDADSGLAATERGGYILLRSGGNEIALASTAELRLLGKHNVSNALAAVLAAQHAGVDLDAIRAGLRSFGPLPHRLTPVSDAGGVKWIDDSKATNPDAAIKALESFDAPVILIAGGKSKKTDFSRLAAIAAQRAKLVILIGEASQEIKASILDTGATAPPVVEAPTLASAVEAAQRAALPGDVVLLSPACASFDMFENAEQRGELFADAVHKLRKRNLAAS